MLSCEAHEQAPRTDDKAMPRSRPSDRPLGSKPDTDPFDAVRDPAATYARGLLAACGLDAPIPDRKGATTAALAWARSGAMALTGPAEGPPRFVRGALASAARGVGLALGALAPGTDLCDLDAPALLAERAALSGLTRQGDVSAGGQAHILATRDDHLVVNLAREEDWHLVPAWLELEGREISQSRDFATLSRILASRESVPLVARGRLMGLAVAPAPTSIPSGGALFSLHHTCEGSPVQRDRPIRLLDLSSLWAGPLATSLLAMANVDVLKIEDPTRPDGAREGPRAFFDLLNANKRAAALDLRAPRDRARFERLLECADVVVESARPRALCQLGYDAAGWVQAKPGRLWTSITGYGRDHEWIAFGDDAAVAAGLAWSPDPRIEGPVFPADAVADPLTGLHAAALVLAHLRRGRGGLLALSLRDVAAHAAALQVPDAYLPVHIGPAESDEWCVLAGDRAFAIAPPRTRAVRGSAPALLPAEDAQLAGWTAGC